MSGRIRWMLLVSVLLSLAAPLHAQDKPLPPYLQYYAYADQAFILERADGTDTRLLAEGVLQEPRLGAWDWSPSGNWLAFQGRPASGCGGGDVHVEGLYLVSADGTVQMAWPGAFAEVQFAWSPVEDLLLVAGRQLGAAGTVFWRLLNPNRDAPLLDRELFQVPVAYRLQWLADGSAGFLIRQDAEGFTRVDRVNSEGRGNSNWVELEDPLISLSPAGWYAYHDGISLRFGNITTRDAALALEVPLQDITVKWHGNEALVGTRHELWWVDLAQPHAVQLLNVPLRTHPAVILAHANWLHDGEALLSTSDDVFYHLQERALTPLDVPPYDRWAWLDDRRIGLLDWATDQIRVLNLLTGDIEVTFATNVEPATLAFSADRQWAGFVEDGAVLVHTQHDTRLEVPPNVNGYQGNRGGFVTWHPTQNWLIAEEEGPAACGSTSYTTVTDGDTYYWVTGCRGRRGCVRWLPARVVISDNLSRRNESTPPSPTATWQASTWIEGLAWSLDGQYVQVFPSLQSTEAPTIWEVASGQVVPEIETTFTSLPEREHEILWEDGPAIVAQHNGLAIDVRGTVYDADTHEPLYALDSYYTATGGPYHFSEDYILAGSHGASLLVWDIQTGERLYEGPEVTAAALSPEGSSVAIARGWVVEVYVLAALID